MKAVGWFCNAATLAILGYTCFYWVTHPDTTTMRMLVDFWPWYLGAVAMAFVGALVSGTGR